jgi:hypothetical protein
MKINSINKNIIQMAASNWQLANGNGNLATGKWLLTTGCLQTFSGKKLLDSKLSEKKQSKGSNLIRP